MFTIMEELLSNLKNKKPRSVIAASVLNFEQCLLS